jgi:hypothetical protein
MKTRFDSTLLAAAVALIAFSQPGAADTSDPYGSAATGMPYDRAIRLGPNTKSVGVWRFETISFTTAEGREFRWRFDTVRELDVFPLARIAPTDVAIPAGANVYVNGEIPIAP